MTLEYEIKQLWLVDGDGRWRVVFRVYDRTAGRFAAVSQDFEEWMEAVEWIRAQAA